MYLIGWQLTRLQTFSGDGTMAYERRHGKKYVHETLVVGETAHFKTVDKKGKAEPRWTKGVYAGKADLSDEVYVLTPSGVGKARTFQRKPESERWGAGARNSVEPSGSPAGGRRSRDGEHRRRRGAPATHVCDVEYGGGAWSDAGVPALHGRPWKADPWRAGPQ